MQRLFVMFPDRTPGIGLLWLRLCLAGVLCWPWPASSWHGIATAVVALLLVAGWLTPLAVLLAMGGLWLQAAPWPAVALPGCLWLLGPGAYSLDSCLFGRRVLTRLPPPKE